MQRTELSYAFMMAAPFDIWSLRCTRTRISKPQASSQNARVRGLVSKSIDSSEDTRSRDWSRHMEKGKYGRMRVLFLGHNPSAKSWDDEAPYAHGSNRFWKLLDSSGLAQSSLCIPALHVRYPKELGYAFADLVVTKGSVASEIKDTIVPSTICARILEESGGMAPRILACVSKSVAEKMLSGWNKKGGEGFGKVGIGSDWGFEGGGFEDTEIWVLPSTSGRAPMKWEDRLEPFRMIAEAIKEHPWPNPEETSSTLECKEKELL